MSDNTGPTADTGILAWHFLPTDRRPTHDIGRSRAAIKVGETYWVEPPIRLCERGLHASIRAIDALKYAPGPVVCRVRLSGEVLNDSDKCVATERTVLAMADATTLLHEFTCWCAEQALLRERAAGREPDQRSWAAIKAKRRWLRGEINDDELAAARAAARDAATSAAWPAARAAVWAAVWAAARDAAWAAAWAAVWDVQNTELESRLTELLAHQALAIKEARQ